MVDWPRRGETFSWALRNLRHSVSKLLDFSGRAFPLFLVAVRFLAIHSFVATFWIFRRWSSRRWVFNLDCHISVIADLKVGLKEFPGIRLVSWSISGHNFVFRKIFQLADPVKHINSRSWMNLTPAAKAAFLRSYRKFLENFDGFIVTYPPAFVELFEDFRKPILLVVAIRYERPFSSDYVRWTGLTETFSRLRNEQRLTLVANNKGDAEYLRQFMGEDVPVVASVCDYVPSRSQLVPHRYPIFARSEELLEFIKHSVGGRWESKKDALGQNYGWNQLLECSAVIYIPYTNSVMSLFEFATLGIPVLVPDRNLIKQIASQYDGVLSELTFLDIENLEAPSGAPEFPGLHPDRPGYLDWWLDNSDFYDSKLMPNVIQFSSFDDPIFGADFHEIDAEAARVSAERNSRVQFSRKQLLEKFQRDLETEESRGEL